MINFDHSTNDISASSGSVTINGAAMGSGGGLPSAFSTFTIVDGELIVEHSSSFTLSLVDGEFTVGYN